MAEVGKPPLQKPPDLRNTNKPSGLPVVRPPPPVRKAGIPPAFKPKKRRRSCCRLCCCFFCCFVLILIVVVLIAGGLFYLLYEPKLPIFHLESFKLLQFNVTAKQDGTYLDCRTTSRIELKNPNSKVQLIYGKTSVTISVLNRDGGEETELGTKEIEKFTQGKKNTTSLKVETVMKNCVVNDGLGTKLKKGYKNGDLKVKVEAKTGLGFVVEGWKVGPIGININCGRVKLKRVESGEIPKCSIEMLKW